MSETVERQSHLFICHTPYHILLATGVAQHFGDTVNHLIVIGDFSEVPPLVETLRRTPWQPFLKIELLPGVYESKTEFQKLMRAKNVANTVRVLLKEWQVRHLYIFNDFRPEGQGAAYWAHHAGLSVNYVEDGLNAYIPEWTRPRSKLVYVLARLYCGSWWNPVVRLGTHWSIEKRWAMVPSLLEPTLKDKPIEWIDPNWLKIPMLRDYARKYVKTSDKSQIWQNLDTLILLPHSRNIQSESLLEAELKKCMDQLPSSSNVAIKIHVRDQVETFSGLIRRLKLKPLSGAIPAEYLYLSAPQLKNVIAPMSTAALSARLLLDHPNIQILPVGSAVSLEDRLPLRNFVTGQESHFLGLHESVR